MVQYLNHTDMGSSDIPGKRLLDSKRIHDITEYHRIASYGNLQSIFSPGSIRLLNGPFIDDFPIDKGLSASHV